MQSDRGVEEQRWLTRDEIKLIEKYRECLEKLKPGQSGVGRSWSFPLIESSGDSIGVSVELRYYSHEPKSSSSDVIIEGARAHLKT